MARHDEKTSAGSAKMLSGGDTGDRLAEVNKVLGCLAVPTVEHDKAELERDTPVRDQYSGSKYSRTHGSTIATTDHLVVSLINAYLEVDAIGVDEVVFGADDAYLRVAKFANISVQDAYFETSDKVIANTRLGGVWLRLTQ